jgi:Domain of unknown function (DUF4082)
MEYAEKNGFQLLRKPFHTQELYSALNTALASGEFGQRDAGTATPSTVDSGDGASVNVGVAFWSETVGYITGVRFYKATTNTGTHKGDLWYIAKDPGGGAPKLAEVTFTGETASGRQTMSFSSPVAISPYTLYLASVLMPNGHYSENTSYFSYVETINSPLHAALDTTNYYRGSGPTISAYSVPFVENPSPIYNGAFNYSATVAQPNQSFNQTNYWVDVVFSN